MSNIYNKNNYDEEGSFVKKSKWIAIIAAIIGLLGAAAGIAVAIHRLGCIALFDDEMED